MFTIDLKTFETKKFSTVKNLVTKEMDLIFGRLLIAKNEDSRNVCVDIMSSEKKVIILYTNEVMRVMPTEPVLNESGEIDFERSLEKLDFLTFLHEEDEKEET